MKLELKRLTTIDEQLTAQVDDRDDFDDDVCQIPTMNLAEYEQHLQRRGKTSFGIVWAEYRKEMMKLGDAFGNSDAAMREEIRAAIRRRPTLRGNLPVLIEEQSWRVNATSDASLVRTLLLLLAVADLGDDPVAQSVLTDLYYQAKKAQVDIDRLLPDMTTYCSDTTQRVGSSSTKQYFASFVPTRGWS